MTGYTMLRFTIRDLLWLMVVVGMGCAWVLERSYDRRQHAVQRKELGEKLAATYQREIDKLRETNARWRDGMLSAAVASLVSHCMTVDCSELPADDKALEEWLRSNPYVQVLRINRRGKTVEAVWGTSGELAKLLGDRPIAEFRLELERLGYKGLTRLELN